LITILENPWFSHGRPPRHSIYEEKDFITNFSFLGAGSVDRLQQSYQIYLTLLGHISWQETFDSWGDYEFAKERYSVKTKTDFLDEPTSPAFKRYQFSVIAKKDWGIDENRVYEFESCRHVYLLALGCHADYIKKAIGETRGNDQIGAT